LQCLLLVLSTCTTIFFKCQVFIKLISRMTSIESGSFSPSSAYPSVESVPGLTKI
jgi:hypothetical protein